MKNAPAQGITQGPSLFISANPDVGAFLFFRTAVCEQGTTVPLANSNGSTQTFLMGGETTTYWSLRSHGGVCLFLVTWH